MERAVGYARLGSQRIAYEVFGSGTRRPGDDGGELLLVRHREDAAAELFFRRLGWFAA